MNKHVSLLRKRYVDLRDTYLGSELKKVELLFYISVSIALGLIQYKLLNYENTYNIRAYISHIQSCIVILMAFDLAMWDWPRQWYWFWLKQYS